MNPHTRTHPHIYTQTCYFAACNNPSIYYHLEISSNLKSYTETEEVRSNNTPLLESVLLPEAPHCVSWMDSFIKRFSRISFFLFSCFAFLAFLYPVRLIHIRMCKEIRNRFKHFDRMN